MSSAARSSASLPGTPPTGEPVAVYLQWLAIGITAGTVAALYPVLTLLDALSAALPQWSQVSGGAALGLLVLAGIERCKRDRRGVAMALGGAALALCGVALHDGLLRGTATGVGWALVLGGFALGALQLCVFEDWIAGRCGPRTRQLSAALRDVALWPWWFWFSKRAIAIRSERRERQHELRERRERDWVARKSAEDLAEQLAAERRAHEHRLAAAEAEERAALAEQRAARERRRADEEQQQAIGAQSLRIEVELKLARARQSTEELNRQADAAALERTRLRQQQIEAERVFIEAASAARKAAETALQYGAEAERAQALLESVERELSGLCAAEPEPARAATAG